MSAVLLNHTIGICWFSARWVGRLPLMVGWSPAREPWKRVLQVGKNLLKASFICVSVNNWWPLVVGGFEALKWPPLADEDPKWTAEMFSHLGLDIYRLMRANPSTTWPNWQLVIMKGEPSKGCSCPQRTMAVWELPSGPLHAFPKTHLSSKVAFRSSQCLCGHSRAGGICLSSWCSLEEFPHGELSHHGSFFIQIRAVEIMLIKLECNYRPERFFAVWIELL